jgi:multiple sugar transport system permease protein
MGAKAALASFDRRRTTTSEFRGAVVWYPFVIPPFLLILLFVVYPTIETFRQSFFRQVAQAQQFAGLEQYSRLAHSGVFWHALANTALLGAAFLILVIPLATVLASLLNRVRRGGAPLKVIYFLPQLTSSVAVAIMFNYVFQPDWGLLNGFLKLLGVEAVPLWLADPSLGVGGSRAAVTILAVWAGLGYFILIVLAGLQSIPAELYEAATIDGANGLQMWRHITLPSLRPTFIFLIMTGTVDAMSRFADLWTLGGPGGAPARSLQTMVMLIFQTGFESGDVSLAAAIAVIFFMLMLGLTVMSFWALLAREFRPRR